MRIGLDMDDNGKFKELFYWSTRGGIEVQVELMRRRHLINVVKGFIKVILNDTFKKEQLEFNNVLKIERMKKKHELVIEKAIRLSAYPDNVLIQENKMLKNQNQKLQKMNQHLVKNSIPKKVKANLKKFRHVL
jgi:hypothetical protein